MILDTAYNTFKSIFAGFVFEFHIFLPELSLEFFLELIFYVSFSEFSGEQVLKFITFPS